MNRCTCKNKTTLQYNQSLIKTKIQPIILDS